MPAIGSRLGYAALAVSCLIVSPACDSSSPLGTDSFGEAAGKGNGRGGSKSSLSVSPSQVDFGSSSSSATMTLKNSSRLPVSWTAAESAGWLSLGATSGTIAARSSGTVSVAAARGGLTAGSYATTVTVSASDGSAAVPVPVAMTVASSSGSGGQLSVSPVAVDFGSSATTASVTLTNAGDGSLSWTASESAGWLSLGETSGTVAAHSSKTVSLSAQRTGMGDGTYTTRLVVDGGTAGVDTTDVSLTVASATSVLLSGQVVDQFGGLGLGGLRVEFRGSAATTDAAGRFTIPGSPTSTLSDLTVTGTGVHTRRTFARTGDDQWRVLPASFSMTAFDDLARDEFGPATVRWVAPPTVYVDTRPEGFSDGPELQRWIVEVQSLAAAFVSKWTGATMSPADVIVTSNPPRDYSAGTIVIHFSEDPARYNNTNAIGYARLSWSREGAISGSALWLRYVRYSGDGYTYKRTGILGHELGHAMGMGHMNGSTLSLMQPSLGSKTDLSAFDAQAALVLYTRAPGNSAPDTDSSKGYSVSGSLSPASAPQITEWICRDESDIETR